LITFGAAGTLRSAARLSVRLAALHSATKNTTTDSHAANPPTAIATQIIDTPFGGRVVHALGQQIRRESCGLKRDPTFLELLHD
jgi:hypothetical protein